jgi:hypothetical protein
MPQLVPRHAHIAGYALAFAVTDTLIARTWLATVAWVSDRARALLCRPASGPSSTGQRGPRSSRWA